MNKDKQFEEMAKILCEDFGTKNCNIRCDAMCDVHFYAERLYKEGYRKQSEMSPCDVCQFNPPSSFDGKPCAVCPAQPKMRKEDEGK